MRLPTRISFVLGGCLMIMSAAYAVMNSSGLIMFLSIIGSILLVPLPLILLEIATELYRAAWQSWRITVWLCSEERNGTTRPKPNLRQRTRTYLSCLRREIFAGYTTVTVAGQIFYFDPAKEPEYFAEQERRYAAEEASWA